MEKPIRSEHASGRRADRRALVEIDDLIDDGIYDAASVLAWEVQRIAPGDPAVWLLLARIDYLRERFAAAMYAARMATRLDPSSSEAWLALAMTAVTRARWRTEGLDAALQATALAPSDPRGWTVLSQLHLAGGAVYDAAVAAEQAIRVDPNDRGGHLMLGETALDAGELAHAEAAFRRVLELDSEDPDALEALAEVLDAREVHEVDPSPRDDAPDTGRETAAPADAGHVPTDAATRSELVGRRIAALAVAGSVVVGLLAGLAIPGLGVVRGLIGGIAVALMWIAVGPVRDPRRDRPVSVAQDVDDAPEPSGRRWRPARSLTRELASGQETADPGAGRSAASGGARGEDAEVPAPTGTGSALAVPGSAAEQLPDSREELIELSREGLAESDVELAHAAASRLDAVAPDSAEAHRALGAVALAEQDYEQAALHYRRLLELEPGDREATERLEVIGDTPERRVSRLTRRGQWSRR
ncbi:MAG TPA: tetratricopeptide repeat protein [Euzebyales bacterium]